MDRSHVPNLDAHPCELTLRQRVGQLICECKLPALRDGWEAPLDFYGHPDKVRLKQLRLL